MFENLRVKDEELFGRLSAICADLTRSTQLLERLLAGARADEDGLLMRIRATDSDAQGIARALDTQTFKAFLMRLDRMELHELVTALERAIAGVEEAASEAQAVHASGAPAHLRAVAGAATESARALEGAMPHIGRPGDSITPFLARTQQARIEGEEAYYAGMELLFANDPDAVDVLRWKVVYEKIRQALESTATVATTLERMSLAHQ